MSWQIAPGLIIIGGAFSAVGGIFAGVDWLSKKFYDQVSFLRSYLTLVEGSLLGRKVVTLALPCHPAWSVLPDRVLD
jgi:hypothetical protein